VKCTKQICHVSDFMLAVRFIRFLLHQGILCLQLSGQLFYLDYKYTNRSWDNIVCIVTWLWTG